jgi:molecular chaperone DnaK
VIKASSGLSDEEIEKMVADAEANADADAKFEEMIQVRNTADSMIHATKKTLEEAGDKASDDEKSAIEAAIADAEAALKDGDKEAIEAATAKLTEASGPLAQRMYEEQAAAQQGADAGEQSSGKADDDDAVDAEFEEVKDK